MKRLLLVPFAFLALLLPASAGLNIAVDPLVIEMRALPGQVVKADVNISNNSDTPERIVIAPMDWITRVDGSLAIEKPGHEARSITRYLKASASQFTLAPNEKRVVTVTLVLPTTFSAAAASYWGGYFARATLGTGRVNGFGPGATIVVYVDVGNPHRSVTLQTLRASASGHNVHVIARIKDTSNAYVRAGATLLFEQGGRVVQKLPVTIGAIFPGRFHTVDETARGLGPGKYRVELSIDYGGDEIEDGETTVTVP
ncbi:MAG: hypothetical protein GIW97_05800 [Candidatus Eremiobacteraeota bacterium]|nr:hypothetical protein [Candidatus Eremiobacteraeota bacterium]